MTRAFADSLGMVEPYGAIFGQPRPGSPAAQAGIEAGDVITAINGTPLTRSRDFAAKISKRAPGSVIYLTTFRNGELMGNQADARILQLQAPIWGGSEQQNLKASLTGSSGVPRRLPAHNDGRLMQKSAVLFLK